MDGTEQYNLQKQAKISVFREPHAFAIGVCQHTARRMQGGEKVPEVGLPPTGPTLRASGRRGKVGVPMGRSCGCWAVQEGRSPGGSLDQKAAADGSGGHQSAPAQKQPWESRPFSVGMATRYCRRNPFSRVANFSTS